MVGLENIVNQSKIKLNYFYKKFKYLTLLSLIPLSVAFFDGCKKDSPTQTTTPTPAKNKPPVVTIIQPTNNNFTITSNDAITFRWQGTDPDGDPIIYNYGLSEINENSNTQISYSNLRAQNYRFHVQAKDNKGGLSNTEERLFTVQTYIPPVGPTGNTNSSGYVKIQLGSTVFDVYVKNLSNQFLNNIKVSGFSYETNLHGFLAEDFSGKYLSEVVRYPSLGKRETSVTPQVTIFQRAKENNRKRIEKLYNYRRDKGILKYIGTTPLTDLHLFYKEHDAIFNNMSFLEFVVRNTGEGTAVNAAFTFALEAAKFREDIINNAGNVGEIINTVVSYFGQGYDTDAYYFDVYTHKNFGILTHVENIDKLCTLKGKITDTNNQSIANARVSISFFYEDTDQNGNYVIKSYKDVTRNIERLLKEGNYMVTASATNYVLEGKNINLIAPTPPYYTSTKLDFKLGGPIGGDEKTIVFQPKSDGIDAYVASNAPNTNYGNDASLYTWYQPNVTLIRSYLRLDFATMPRFSQINSAILSLNGTSWHVYDSNLSQTEASVKRITSSWGENSITWNSQPQIGETMITKKLGSPGWHDFDITPLTNNWLRGTQPNYGVVIMLYNESIRQEATFHSSDVSGSTQPKLTIKYKP